jgi:hypothetical protein
VLVVVAEHARVTGTQPQRRIALPLRGEAARLGEFVPAPAASDWVHAALRCWTSARAVSITACGDHFCRGLRLLAGGQRGPRDGAKGAAPRVRGGEGRGGGRSCAARRPRRSWVETVGRIDM